MKRILCFGILLILAGCSGRWTQEGKGYIETKQDGAACADTILAEHRDLNEETVKACMEAKGYRRNTAQQVDPTPAPPLMDAPTPKVEPTP